MIRRYGPREKYSSLPLHILMRHPLDEAWSVVVKRAIDRGHNLLEVFR